METDRAVRGQAGHQGEEHHQEAAHQEPDWQAGGGPDIWEHGQWRVWQLERSSLWILFIFFRMSYEIKLKISHEICSHHTLNSKATAIIIKMFYFQVLGSHFLTELTTIPSLTSPLTRSIRFWWRQALLRSGLNYRKTSEWAKIKWEMSWRKWDRLWVQHLWQERSMRCGWD